MFTEHRFKSSDGLSLYYRLYQPDRANEAHSGADTDTSGRTVLCLHGLTRNSKDFHRLAEHLSQPSHGGWRVICPDIRGRGQSEHDRNHLHYNPGWYVKDVWRLLDSEDVGEVVIIGTSLGGLMAMIMADQRPDHIRGIVMNDIGPELPPDALARIKRYAGKNLEAENWRSAARQARIAYEVAFPGRPDEFWDDFVRLSYRENDQGLPEPDADPAIGSALRKPPAVLVLVQKLHRLGLLRRIGGVNIDPWDSFRAITMPCLLIHGELSDVLTCEIIDKMLSVNPQMKVTPVPDSGHAPMLEEPVPLDALTRFLQSLID